MTSFHVHQLVLALPVYPRVWETPVVGIIDPKTPRVDKPNDRAHVFVATLEETRICLRRSVEPIQPGRTSQLYADWVAIMLQDVRLELTRYDHIGHYVLFDTHLGLRVEDNMTFSLTTREVAQLRRQQKTERSS